MNMVPSLSAMEARIVVAKNAIAIIVVYFLIVNIIVRCELILFVNHFHTSI